MSKHPHIQHLSSAEEEDCLRPDQLEGFVAGNLAGEEKTYAEQHVRNCELCAMTVESMGEMDAASLEAGAAAISEAAWGRISVQERKRRAGAWVWISAAASVMLVAVVGFILMRGPGQQVKMDELAEGLYETPTAPGKAPATTQGGFDFGSDSIAGENGPSAGISNGLTNAMPKPSPDEAIVEMDDVVKGSGFFADAKDIAPNMELEDLEEVVILADKYVAQPADNAPVASGKASFGDGFKRNNNATAPVQLQEKSMTLEDSDDALLDFNMPGTTSGNEVAEIEEEDVSQELDEVRVVSKIEEPKLNIVIDGGDITASRDVKRMESATSSTVVVESRSLSKSPGAQGNKNRKKAKRDRNQKGISGQQDAFADEINAEYKKEVTSGEYTTGDVVNLGAVAADSVAMAPAPISVYDEGLDAYRQGYYQESADLLRQAAAATPANLEAHYYAAASFMNIDQPQAAVYHLNRVLAVPGNALYADAQWYKALAYLKLSERAKAKALLEKIEAAGGKHAKPARKALDKF